MMPGSVGGPRPPRHNHTNPPAVPPAPTRSAPLPPGERPPIPKVFAANPNATFENMKLPNEPYRVDFSPQTPIPPAPSRPGMERSGPSVNIPGRTYQPNQTFDKMDGLVNSQGKSTLHPDAYVPPRTPPESPTLAGNPIHDPSTFTGIPKPPAFRYAPGSPPPMPERPAPLPPGQRPPIPQTPFVANPNTTFESMRLPNEPYRVDFSPQAPIPPSPSRPGIPDRGPSVTVPSSFQRPDSSFESMPGLSHTAQGRSSLMPGAEVPPRNAPAGSPHDQPFTDIPAPPAFRYANLPPGQGPRPANAHPGNPPAHPGATRLPTIPE